MKKNIFYFVVFFLMILGGSFLFSIYYQENYIKIDEDLVLINLNNEYWTSEDVVVTVDYQNKDVKIKSYSFDGGKNWQSENQYTATENQKLEIVLKTESGKKSSIIPYHVENIDKENPKITVEDIVYVAQGSEFSFQNVYQVSETVSGIRDQVQIKPEVIDTSKIRSYEVQISVLDKALNSDSKRFVVEVVDPKDPRLQLIQKPTVINVTGLTLSSTRISLVKGTSTTVKPIIKPSNATNQNIIWISSDESIATVDQTGKITAQKAGAVTITATTEDGNKSSDIRLTVTDEKIEVVKITLDKTSDSVTTASKPITLVATISPENATDTTIKWNSSDPNVAIVIDGVVTVRGEGVTTITAISSNGKMATYQLKVADQYTFQEKEVRMQTGELMGYTLKIYQNGVDITNKVTVVTSPFTVRNDRGSTEIEITVANHSLLKDSITFNYKSKRYTATK